MAQARAILLLLKIPINFSSMTNLNHENKHVLILHLVNNPIVAVAYPA